MICPNCKSENIENNEYCGNCGEKLKTDILPKKKYKELLSKLSKNIINNQLKVLEHETKNIETQELLSFQNKIENHIKSRLSILGGILAILIAILAFLGINEYNDLKNGIIEKQEDIIEELNETEIRIREIDSLLQVRMFLLNNELDSASGIISGIKQKQKTLEKLNSIQQETENLIIEARTTADTVNKIRDDYKIDHENAKKLQNSTFRLFVHCPGKVGNKSRESNLNKLKKTLINKGFVINEANIGNIGVDSTEVLFYNNISEEQARLIYKILIDSLKQENARIRYLQRKERNPKEILIKLKLNN